MRRHGNIASRPRCFYGNTAQRHLKNKYRRRHNKCHHERACKCRGCTHKTAAAQRLRRESTGTHAKESEHPVNHIEHHCPYGYGTYVGGTAQMACYRHIDESEKRHGDVGDNGGHCYAENLAVGLP